MSESFPSFENTPPAREEVVSALSCNSPESEQLLTQLVASWEATVENSFEGRINHLVNIALLYEEAGLLERAFHTYEDAAEMAFQEYQDELASSLEMQMERIKNLAGR